MFIAILFSCASDYEILGAKPDVDPGLVTECDFIPVSGTKISQYDCNPVFDGGEAGAGSIAFHATEVLGHPFYQLWYTDEVGSMNYAASSDGTSWLTNELNPIFDLTAGAWDQDSVSGQVVVWDPVEREYIMSYQGINFGNPSDGADDIWGIGVSTSPDGVTWTKHPNNPVINFSDFLLDEFEMLEVSFGGALPAGKEIRPSWPLTITVDNRGSLRGYIGASRWEDILGGDPFAGTTYPQVDVYAMNGFSAGEWVLNSNAPVLSGGDSYDLYGMTGASVVEFNDVQYMFYVGFSQWQESAEFEGVISAAQSTLNLATSVDGGVTWVKDPNNPLPINTTANLEVSDVGAQVIGSRIMLWVTDNYDDKAAVGYFYYEPEIDDHE